MICIKADLGRAKSQFRRKYRSAHLLTHGPSLVGAAAVDSASRLAEPNLRWKPPSASGDIAVPVIRPSPYGLR